MIKTYLDSIPEIAIFVNSTGFIGYYALAMTVLQWYSSYVIRKNI